ncbi:hypothetical protein [Azohydromonas aeria]|uniref:hypothetical protein n=1 Tax=Azohydromonas aeria TaxID=2590212 RepID=UPI0018DFD495|nr:hypothetical protein [Azohydromonas aeria]
MAVLIGSAIAGMLKPEVQQRAVTFAFHYETFWPLLPIVHCSNPPFFFSLLMSQSCKHRIFQKKLHEKKLAQGSQMLQRHHFRMDSFSIKEFRLDLAERTGLRHCLF